MSLEGPVAVFLPALHGGGAERNRLTLAGGLSRDGTTVDVVVAHGVGALMDHVPQGVKLVDLGARRLLTSVLPFVRYLRRRRPRAVISGITHANAVAVVAAALAGTGARVVVVEHNTLSVLARTSPRWRDRVAPVLVRSTYPHADAVAAVSRGAARDLERTLGWKEGRVHVLPNPVVRPELFHRARAPVDDTWFAPGAPPVIVSAGRLEPQKDHGMLLDAFARLRRERSARLLVLGEGSERPGLELRRDALGLGDDVRLPGYVDDPYPYLARAAVLALTSRFEGLPTVLIEALALGTPVVATDCPSGPGEILADGRYGRLVAVGDAEEMTRALAETLDDPPTVPPEAWERYTVDTAVATYRQLLNRLP